MKRRRLNAKEKRALECVDSQPLFYDPRRRLHNALLVIMKNDPRWMLWVEGRLPKQIEDLNAALEIVEQRARDLVLTGYSCLSIRQNERMIFNDNGVMVQV